MLKKILACLDGSKFAEWILPHAIERARSFNSKVVLLRVITVNIVAYATFTSGLPPIVAPSLLQVAVHEEEIRAKSYLGSIAVRLREMGLDVNWVALHGIIRGSIASDIINYAAANEVDLIILATHGYSNWKHLVFGSVAESVIRNSSSPVLVVGPTDTETEDGAFGRIPEGTLA